MSALVVADSDVTVVAFSCRGGSTRRRRLKKRRRPSAKRLETFVIAQVLRLTVAHDVVLAFHHLSQVRTPYQDGNTIKNVLKSIPRPNST